MAYDMPGNSYEIQSTSSSHKDASMVDNFYNMQGISEVEGCTN